MEGNTPLPPHSTEESPQQSEVQDTTTSQEEVPTPLENFRIVLECQEAFRIPEGYERCVLQLNSVGEFVIVNPSDIPIGSHSNPLVNDPFCTADIVRSPPRMVWDLYGAGVGVDAPISYTVPLNHFTGTTIFTDALSVGPNTSSIGPRSTFPLQTAHSTMVPHIPTIPASNVVVNQAAIGTPVTPRPTSSLPFGYRALNFSTATTTQVMPGSSIPIQQLGGIGFGGLNPFSHLHLVLKFRELYLKLGGILPPEDNFHLGGTLMQGGTLNLELTINRMDTMCLPHLIHGITLFQETHSSQQDTILKLHNNPLMEKCQIQLIIIKTHPIILCSHMFLKTPQILCTRGPTSYNYLHNPVYGPTGVPMPHQYYPQVNRQLPFNPGSSRLVSVNE
jgi:hypothetical protein